MGNDILKKIRLISKSGFLASSLLNIGAMDSENKIIEIKKTVEYEVDKSLKIIREAREKMKTNFLNDFKDIINNKNYKYRKDFFYQRKRIGSIIPLNSEILIEKNKQLYENLNEIFDDNFFTDFKFNNILDQYIKFNSIYDYVNNLPSIKRLWNIYGKKGYSAKLYNFYDSIKSINVENINFFSDKYKTEKNSCELNKEDRTLGRTSINKNYISLGIIDCFLNNVINRNKEESLSERNLIELFDEKILNEISSNKTTTFHELCHFNNDIIEILSDKKNSNETDSFTAIESDIHKIIRAYCYLYNINNKKIFLSSKISEILDFINKKLTDEKLKKILEFYKDKIYNNEVKNVNYSEKLKRIKEFLNFGSREQQCKLLEILSYVGNISIIHDNNEVKNNITAYGTSTIDEMSAECCSFSLFGKDEYNKYSEILFAFEYSYITKFLNKRVCNSTNLNISNRFILKEEIQEKVKGIDKYDDYILDILKLIKVNNNTEIKGTINLNISKKNKQNYNKLDFNKKFYRYLILTLTKEEEENLKKSDDKNIKKLLKEYKKKIKYTDFLEDCYVDNIMNESLGLKTYFFELEYKNEKEIYSDDDSDDNVGYRKKGCLIEQIEFVVKKISESEIKTTVDKIKKLMEDFYEYLFRKNDKNLEKLNILDKVQLICIFYRILNDNKEKIKDNNDKSNENSNKENFYKYECNTLDSIAINNILNNIIIEKNVKYSLKEQQDKNVNDLKCFFNILKNNKEKNKKYSSEQERDKVLEDLKSSIYDEVEDVRKANDDMNIDYFVDYKKFNTLVGNVVTGKIKDGKFKELNIELKKNKNIDDCKVILYINKDYLENIKKGIFEEYNNNDNKFWICKNFDNDRDSKKFNYYFDKSNFMKNDLSEFIEKKENINKTYESFNEEYKKIIKIFHDFDGNYLFYDLYDKYCKNDDSDDSDDADEDSDDIFNKKRKKNRKRNYKNSDDSDEDENVKNIIEKSKKVTKINTLYITDLLVNINNYTKTINENEKKGIEENYKKLCIIYDNIINLLPFQFEKFKELKDEFLKEYEELNKKLEEINKKMNEFNNLFKNSNDNIIIFIKKNIKEIYNNIPEKDKNNRNFINFFNKKYGTTYQIKRNKESESESESDED